MAEDPKYPLVHSMKTGADYEQLINDENGDFRKWNKEFIEKNPDAIAVLQKIGSGNPEHVSLDALKDMKGGAYNLWLKITVLDSNKKPIELDSSEFIAWQREAPDKKVDVWAKEIGLDIISNKRTVVAGEQNLNIEWEEGNRRAVTYKGIVSEKRDGYYGEIAIKDSKGNVVYNSDGLPDIFLTKEAMKQVESGVPYRGRVVVMDQVSGGNFDEVKFYFGAKAGQADEQIIADFSKMQASAFTDKSNFHNKSEGKYTAMSYPQYQAWTQDVSVHPESASMAFADWVDKKWGSKEKFDEAFAGRDVIYKEDKLHNGEDFKKLLEKAGLNNFADAKKLLGDGMSVLDLNQDGRMDKGDLFKLSLDAAAKLQQKIEKGGRQA